MQQKIKKYIYMYITTYFWNHNIITHFVFGPHHHYNCEFDFHYGQVYLIEFYVINIVSDLPGQCFTMGYFQLCLAT